MVMFEFTVINVCDCILEYKTCEFYFSFMCYVKFIKYKYITVLSFEVEFCPLRKYT